MLLKYLPEFMGEAKEMQAIMGTGDIDIEKIHKNIDNVLEDMFVKYATIDGVLRYEKILQIYPNNLHTLEDRKDKILAIYNEILPFTEYIFKNMLNSLCGKDGYIYEISYNELSLNIIIMLSKKQFEIDIRQIAERIVPMNIALDIRLKYNIWNDLSTSKWENVAKYTWNNIKEMELD